MGKNSFGPYNVTQGGGFEVFAPTKLAHGPTALSGATEPVWPTTEYATVVDGGITWTAIFARKMTGAVTGVLSSQVFQHGKIVYPAHYFQYGFMKWLTGANAGRRIDIRDSLGPQTLIGGAVLSPYIFMMELAPNPIEIGDTFEATVGCSKNRLKCQFFNNMANFRGFPDMPTEERALATPNIMSSGYAPKQTK